MSLSSILKGTQTPHQPFLVICDTPTLSGQPVIAELVKRAVAQDTPVSLVCVLHPPETYGIRASGDVRVLDLTDDAAGFFSSSSSHDDPFKRLEAFLNAAVEEQGRGVQVFIDALDVLVEDYAALARGVRIIKALLQHLRGLKAPSRLVLLLPSSAALLDHLLPTSTNNTLTLLQLHPPSLIAHLSNEYLVNPPPNGTFDTDGARFWGILNVSDGLGTAGWAGGQAGDIKGKGHARADGLKRALSAHEATDEVGDWTSPSAPGVVVQVLVRKSQGGAGKGMSRSLEGLRMRRLGMEACAWNELDGLGDVGRTVVHAEQVETQENHPSQAHIPFNLALTPAQQASRAQVPIPYAHEGDAPEPTAAPTMGGIFFEPGSDDDMDDDDPDEDLDF